MDYKNGTIAAEQAWQKILKERRESHHQQLDQRDHVWRHPRASSQYRVRGRESRRHMEHDDTVKVKVGVESLVVGGLGWVRNCRSRMSNIPPSFGNIVEVETKGRLSGHRGAKGLSGRFNRARTKIIALRPATAYVATLLIDVSTYMLNVREHEMVPPRDLSWEAVRGNTERACTGGAGWGEKALPHRSGLRGGTRQVCAGGAHMETSGLFSWDSREGARSGCARGAQACGAKGAVGSSDLGGKKAGVRGRRTHGDERIVLMGLKGGSTERVCAGGAGMRGTGVLSQAVE
ncbi:hypothetical protein L226DRAFT_527666 [Lentinus tigrinus ALCF2SS1-7]|uniref:uncharacterized protein n=1 Tax=Lentinus tigrinus ALCF2SS1-7 TaxID=1328758 RepID=UPI00116618CE|nr:hypothetical protein L226DRAFT_527666 [Lentinus tigrinus ALCF2SS1-7]